MIQGRQRLQASTLHSAAQAIRQDPDFLDRCQRLLWPLQREDQERGHNLLLTLQTYYACGMRVDKTAARMFLHRNSVRYRLDRIRSLLRADIDHPECIAAFMLALHLCQAPPLKDGDADHHAN